MCPSAHASGPNAKNPLLWISEFECLDTWMSEFVLRDHNPPLLAIPLSLGYLIAGTCLAEEVIPS